MREDTTSKMSKENKENVAPSSGGAVRKHPPEQSVDKIKIAALREKKNSTQNQLGRAPSMQGPQSKWSAASGSSGADRKTTPHHRSPAVELAETAAIPITPEQVDEFIDYEAVFVVSTHEDIPIPNKVLEQIEYVLGNDEAFEQLMIIIGRARWLMNSSGSSGDSGNDDDHGDTDDGHFDGRKGRVLGSANDLTSRIPVHIESQRRRSKSASPMRLQRNYSGAAVVDNDIFNTTFTATQ